LVLGGFAVLFCAEILPQWLRSPDLAHGVFMPVVFVLLLRESRLAGPQRFLRPGAWALFAVAGLAGLALALLGVAGLYAAAVDWSNALVLFLLAGALSLFFGAALLNLADGRVRFMPCNWSSVLAAGLWPLAAPIPSGLYARLTLALQLWISTAVMDVLQLLGIAAHRQGNIIELATCRVGVEEACSGVRSLVSCVFVALFFSGTLVRRPAARILVIGVAAPLALAMNFIRALMLTLLANHGVSIAGAWHDATGWAVLLVTAGLLAGLAIALEDQTAAPAGGTAAASAVSPRPGAGNAALAGALALAVAVVAFFELTTHPVVSAHAPGRNLAALLPPPPDNWSATDAPHLERFRAQLQTDVLVQRIYQRGTGSQAVFVILYLAYWRPGQAPVSLVDQHTPDACWPGAGWTPQPIPAGGAGLAIAGRSLAPGEARLFLNDGLPRRVWFWHLYDGQRLPYHNPYSAAELLRLAWHYGFRHDGDQMFVSVSSNRPWAEIADEPLLREFFARLQPLGL
jgi:exosortase